MKRLWAMSGLILSVVQPSLAEAQSPLELTDLPQYRAALQPPGKREIPPISVGFRDLWFHSRDYEGKRVSVEGRLIRRFRQEPFGSFPALTEAWLLSPAGDPFCVVYPAPGRSDPLQGSFVRFSGIYLKKVRYQGSDGPRGAPLIVGADAPKMTTPTAVLPQKGIGFSQLDWTLGLSAATLVIFVLLIQHARRPRRREVRRATEEPLPFIPASEIESDQSGSQTDADRLRGET